MHGVRGVRLFDTVRWCSGVSAGHFVLVLPFLVQHLHHLHRNHLRRAWLWFGMDVVDVVYVVTVLFISIDMKRGMLLFVHSGLEELERCKGAHNVIHSLVMHTPMHGLRRSRTLTVSLGTIMYTLQGTPSPEHLPARSR